MDHDLWLAVEKFLYPDWYKGSAYRDDLVVNEFTRLIQEFYQWPERLSEEQMKEVPIAFAKVQKDDATRWEEESKTVLDFISKLDQLPLLSGGACNH